jgi:NADPH:quinone reductase
MRAISRRTACSNLAAPSRRVSMRELPNSIKICYPVFRDHIPTYEALLSRSQEIFSLVRSGQLKIQIGGRYPLRGAAQTHRDLESRGTTGKLLLLPDAA